MVSSVRHWFFRPLLAVGLAAMGVLGTGPAQALETAWSDHPMLEETEIVSVRVISAVGGVGDRADLPLGLDVRLPGDWKTYWRSPGDAGLPPVITLEGSRNVAAADLSYPAPKRFELFGLQTFGYGERVVFPLTVTPERPGEPIRLAGRADLLICEDVCIPVSAPFSLDIPAGQALLADETASLINRFASQVPDAGMRSGIRFEGLGTDGTGLVVTARATDPFDRPDVFPEAAPFWAFGAPEITLSDGGHRLVARLPVTQTPTGVGGGVPQGQVTVTLVDGIRAAEQTLTVGQERRPDAETGAADLGAGVPNLGLILVLAILGGLILNLMPCVLPVLSIKVLGLLGQGGADRGQIRSSLLATFAGVMAAILALAVALILVRSAGGAIGWGIQFQQPVFLAFMVVVLTGFGANLLGLFELALPSRLATFAGTAGVGRKGPVADFLSGGFQTLLATPCTAPFLGTAVGFALAAGPAEILLIFAALGLGLGLPYLLLAAVPGAVAALPKPGAWMLRLKQVLSLALFGTAAWLLTVLATAASPGLAMAVAALMVGLVAALALRGLGRDRLRMAAAPTAVLLAVAAVALPAFRAEAPIPQGPAAEGWHRFQADRIAPLVDDGQVVLVDITADWCLTCIVNKTRVLERGQVADLLGSGAVYGLRGDWTRPDPAISEYLARHRRFGIPFNIVYGPGAPDGIALPELLDEDTVLAAFQRAGL